MNQNDLISARLFQAADAVKGLLKMGLSVLYTRVENRRTVIGLRQPPRGQLHGAPTVMRGTTQGREYVMAAPYQGCQVQWTEKGK